MLTFASHLDLCLVCTYGMPVADMLAHSPPLPLVIAYLNDFHASVEVEESVVLALRHRDRIRLQLPASNFQRLILAIDREFPMLEYLYFASRRDTSLIFTKAFRAPHLRPHNDEYRLSNRIAITHDTCGPCHTLTSTRPPICILLTKLFAQLALTHAPAGDTPCFFFLRFS